MSKIQSFFELKPAEIIAFQSETTTTIPLQILFQIQQNMSLTSRSHLLKK